MKEPEYISRSEIKDPELEFGNLRKVGVEEIQRLSGSNWTDYNIHDPGVTIFEQLCFAITEMGYKTNFDIQDLLASQHNLQNVNDTFYSPAQILHGKPITIDDYRRILLDRVNGLRDVWIEPLNLRPGGNQIKGTYLVLVKPSPDIVITEEDEEKLKQDTRKCLEKYSNLGEAFDEVVILEEEEIFVRAEIELENEANAALTHARVLCNIRKYISSAVPFYSLNQMVSKGYSFEQIFSGPRLLHGFILDEDLKDKITTLLSSQLINVIYNVEGVLRVKNLNILHHSADEKGELASFTYKLESVDETKPKRIENTESAIMEDGVLIDINKVAVLANDMMPYNPGYKPNIKYIQNRVPVNLYQNNVIRYLRQIENENRVKYIVNYQKLNDRMPEKGKKKPIENYFSIQEHFPEIYALGSRGIPPYFDQKRTTHVKQLKAYLLIFEQIFTNYLAQLTNFSDLFSLKENLKQTYFPGSLASIPYVNQLVEGLENINDTKILEQKTREISREALEVIDDFNMRRHQVLDHLLARFGEKVSNFGISSFNYYFDNEDHQNRMISAKVDLLKEMVFVSAKRAKSFNALRFFWESEKTDEEKKNSFNPENVSYLKKKARIRLGIQTKNRKLCAYLQNQIGPWKPSKRVKTEEVYERLRHNYLANKNLSLHSVAELLEYDEDFDPKIEIYAGLLRRGVWPSNFKIISDGSDKNLFYVAFSKRLPGLSLDYSSKQDIIDKLKKVAQKDNNTQPDFLRFWNKKNKGRHFLIEFRKEEDNKYNPVPSNVWVVIAEEKTEENARAYCSNLINYLRKININTEGFYLIDHIELRPRTELSAYKILIKDKENKFVFESASHYSYADVQGALINLIKEARARDNEFDFFKSNSIGKLRPLQIDREVDHGRFLGDFRRFLNSLTEFDLYDPSIVHFSVADVKDDQVLHGSFYSFRISVIIPLWPARFADDEFKKVMESIIREESPAHIGVDFYYLEFGKLLEFEKLYSKWIDDIRKRSFDNLSKINQSAKKISLFIQELEEESSGD